MEEASPAATSTTMKSAFPQFLRALVRRYGGTDQSFASAAEITESQLSHWKHGRGTPGLESCLRIAKASGENASQVLRAAGHGELADLVEHLYGPAAERRATFHRDRPVTGAEQALLDRWRLLTPHDRQTILRLIASLTRPRRAS